MVSLLALANDRACEAELATVLDTLLEAGELPDLARLRELFKLMPQAPPDIAVPLPDITARADKEGWPAARMLAAVAELELADRARRRIERHLAEARLPTGKTLATFDFTAVPTLSKARVVALAAGID